MSEDFLNFPTHLHEARGWCSVRSRLFGINDGTIRKDSSRIVVKTFLLYIECHLQLLGSQDVCKL